MERTYHCAKIAKGTAEAEALVSKDAVCFYLVVPETGELIERNHDINGKNVAGKILIMPSGKGSSVVQADGLYKLLKIRRTVKGKLRSQLPVFLIRGKHDILSLIRNFM